MLCPTFTDVIVHGLTWTEDVSPCPARLTRTISFPPLIYAGFQKDVLRPPPQGDLSPKPLPHNVERFKLELEARIVPQTNKEPLLSDDSSDESTGSLGSGRSCWVFPLEIICVRAIASNDQLLETPSFDDIFEAGYTEAVGDTTTIFVGKLKWAIPPLCVKIGRPTYSRNLAREAWFYERIEDADLTGLVTPSSFGLFHNTLGRHPPPPTPSKRTPRYDGDETSDEDSAISSSFSQPQTVEIRIPGAGYRKVHREQFVRHPEGHAYMHDNPYPDSYADDPMSSHSTSKWLSYKEHRAVATLTVLILEQVGRPLTVEEFDADPEDAYGILKDLGCALLRHDDIRFSNFLAAPTSYDRVCPRHNRVHRWLLCDWEEGRMGAETARKSFQAQSQDLHGIRLDELPADSTGEDFICHQRFWHPLFESTCV